MKHLEFDVLMPVYFGDKPLIFERALTSVLKNSLQPKNIVIVCDGPLQSETEAVLQQKVLKNLHINVVSYKQNKGIVFALNYGLKFIKSNFVVRCDADDINDHARFAILMEAFENYDVDILGSDVRNIINHKESFVISFPKSNEGIVKGLLFRNQINHMSAAFKYDVVKKVGGYPSIKWREDYGLWLKLSQENCQFRNLNQVLVDVNAGAQQLKRRSGLKHLLPELQLLIMKLRLFPDKKIQIILLSLIRIPYILLPAWIKSLLKKS